MSPSTRNIPRSPERGSGLENRGKPGTVYWFPPRKTGDSLLVSPEGTRGGRAGFPCPPAECCSLHLLPQAVSSPHPYVFKRQFPGQRLPFREPQDDACPLSAKGFIMRNVPNICRC